MINTLHVLIQDTWLLLYIIFLNGGSAHNYKLIEEFKIFVYIKWKKDTKHDGATAYVRNNISCSSKESVHNAGDTRDPGLIPRLGRSLE